MKTAGESPSIIQLRTADNVGVAIEDLHPDSPIVLGGQTIRLAEPVALGHKVALVSIAATPEDTPARRAALTVSSQQPEISWKDWHQAFQPEVAPVRKAWRDLTRGLDQRSFELAESRCRKCFGVTSIR